MSCTLRYRTFYRLLNQCVQLFLQFSFQSSVQLFQELFCIQVVFAMLHFITVDTYSKVLGHFTAFHYFNTNLLQCLAEIYQRLVVIQAATEFQTTGPCEDGGNGVGRGRLTSLVIAVVAGYSTVGSFCFHGFTIRCNQGRGHEAQGAKTLCNGIGLYIAIVVLTGPYKVTVPFQGAGHHVIDQAVLIYDTCSLELRLELILINVFEDIFETAIVFLEDGVLGAEV